MTKSYLNWHVGQDTAIRMCSGVIKYSDVAWIASGTAPKWNSNDLCTGNIQITSVLLWLYCIANK